jgi:hypothetical protein
MRRHEDEFGVSFDDVMVFPQGIFSTVAMAALKSCGYLAAVNSTAVPVDEPDALTLGDLLQVAVTRFAEFPLFVRHYPSRLPEIAFDLFLGKPALLVEHHGYFRDGYDALAETTDKLCEIEPRLQWSSLGSVCSRACWTRVGADGDTHVRYWTDRLRFRNSAVLSRHFVFERNGSTLRNVGVKINGKRVTGIEDGGSQELRVELGAGSSIEIGVEDEISDVAIQEPERSLLYRAGVYARRRLSELRDTRRPWGR